MMKSFAGAVFFALLFFSASARLDTCINDRYRSPIFSTTYQDVVYGVNSTANVMRVFRPQNDNNTCRPLYLFVHGGGFTGGSYTEDRVLEPCSLIAARGFVCASVEYRLGIPNNDYAQAIYRGVQDLKAAIKFFRANAAVYGIDTSQIFIGGRSAGAIIAIHTAYWDANEVPSSVTAAQGNFDVSCLTANRGFSDQVHGLVTGAGAIADSSWLAGETIPFGAIHNTSDATVAYNIGGGLYGSGFINGYFNRNNPGLINLLETLNVPGLHTPNSTTDPNQALFNAAHFSQLYAMLKHRNYATITATGNQLSAKSGTFYQWYRNGVPVSGATGPTYPATICGYYQVLIGNCATCYSLSDSLFYCTSGLNELAATAGFSVFPNPANNEIHWAVDQGSVVDELMLIDQMGKRIKSIAPGQASFSVADVENGYYVICGKINGEAFQRSIVVLH
ncbi:MAG: alpha/beta hydrolase fold domain-containing protein [Chitinophagales bacterium]